MSGPVTFWWVRHGPTHAKTMVGWTDLPADLSNQAQIDRVAAFLPPDAPVVSSDLIRARDTADAIAGGRERLAHRPDLREMHFGAWENRYFAEIEAETPDLIRSFWETPGEIAPPDGESWNTLAARVHQDVSQLTDRGPDIIVVAHFGVILTQVERALGLTTVQAFAHKINNLSVTKIHFDGHWSAELINHHP